MFSSVPVSWVHKETHVAGNIGKEEPDPPQTAAKETSSVHVLSHSICTPNHVISTVPFIPKSSLMGGEGPGAPFLCLQHQGGGAEGRVHHPQPFCWAGKTSWLLWHLVLPGLGLLLLLQPPHYDIPAAPSLPRRVPKPLAPEAPHAPSTVPPAVRSLPATLLLSGLCSGEGYSCLFWKHFLK